MNDSELKKARLAATVKWAIGLLAAAVLAPIVYLAVAGIVGLMLAVVVGLLAINLAPVLAMKFANWKLRGLRGEARANPIETRQAIAIQARTRLKSAETELTTFAAEVRNFADEVKVLRQQQPEDAADFDEQLRKLQQLLDLKRSRLAAARAEADAFEAATERAARKWKVAQSALRMQKLAGAAQDDALNKILAAESLDAVQTAMNRAFAELDSALAATAPPAITQAPAAPVIDIHAVEMRERVAR